MVNFRANANIIGAVGEHSGRWYESDYRYRRRMQGATTGAATPGMPAAVPVLLGDMTGGLIALVVTLVVATIAGLALRRYSGRFRSVRSAAAVLAPGVPGGSMASPLPSTRAYTVAPVTGTASATGTGVQLTEADLGTGLGERATLVQFSTAFCAPCRPTRQILAGVAGMVDGVRHVDIDATTRLDLVRRLRIASTPTVLVLGPDGVIGKRASGLPRKADVIAALGHVIGAELSTSSIGLVDNTGNDTSAESGSDSRSETE
jgi:thiol-disulfide isomerase/thioredoxin